MPQPDFNQTRIEQLWQELSFYSPDKIVKNALVKYDPAGIYHLPFLDKELIFSVANKTITSSHHRLEACATSGEGLAIKNFLEAWVFLSYLTCAQDLPLENKWVSEKELKDGAFFFEGPHQLHIEPIIKKYGADKEAFLKRGIELRGEKTSGYGDAAIRLSVFPRIPLLYVLWLGDAEFPSNVKVLFDPTVTQHLGLDVIWGLVQIVTKHF